MSRTIKTSISLAILPIFLGIILLASNCSKGNESTNTSSTGISDALDSQYIGRESCKECHEREYSLFQGSDHDLAMDHANDTTVLGNFNDFSLTINGITTRFFRQDGKFMVNTEGPGGEMQDFEAKYVFGIRPLQQYLIEFPGGAYQMLPLCWDTRTESEGGQRWYHIYDQEHIPANDILHWTHIAQNWNYMCSECHSTNVRKNFDAESETYNTTWNEIDVSCEACHGPGLKHIEWARVVEQGGNPEAYPDMGLAIRLKDLDNATWVFNMETGTAERSVPRTDRVLVDMCSRCHARRSILSEDYIHGKSFLETHNPSLLDDGLYFADGQILEEVYVYASFLQSKMYKAGVVCSDCHEPHSGKVFVLSNALCYRCHLAEKYGNRSHHFHDPEQEGSSCLECHMPERTYMVVDPRRDHSIRIPRPYLSDQLKSPNACNKCHSDKSNQWAADWCREWYGEPDVDGSHFGVTFWAGRQAYPEALPDLIKIAQDTELAPMIRATAVSLLQNYQDPTIIDVFRQSLSNPDPLMRYAAISSMFAADDNTLLDLALPRLNDSIRLIRITAAFHLARVPAQYFPKNLLQKRDAVIDEYIKTQMINADHPSAHMNLGILSLNRGDHAGAESSYKKAIEIEPALTTAYINLADLYRILQRDQEGQQVLLDAINRSPDMAAVHYALGLNLVRASAHDEAIRYLGQAAELEPGNARYAYVYGVGLHSTGKQAEAIQFLEKALIENRFDRDLLYSLATFNQEAGNREKAIDYAQRLIEYYPSDQNYQQLVQALRSSPN
jgi:tetratricopeptide (TPR) repeat protein